MAWAGVAKRPRELFSHSKATFSSLHAVRCLPIPPPCTLHAPLERCASLDVITVAPRHQSRLSTALSSLSPFYCTLLPEPLLRLLPLLSAPASSNLQPLRVGVCSQARLTLEVDTSSMTLGTLIEQVR
jgi:hypothetical protein